MTSSALTNFIIKRPLLKRWMKPIANWYANAAGYRKLGLKFDDLIPEESETVQTAIKRLPAKDAYDRVFRIRRAFQCSISHTLLPPAEQIKPEEDVQYLSPIIREVEKQKQEHVDLDTLVVRR